MFDSENHKIDYENQLESRFIIGIAKHFPTSTSHNHHDDLKRFTWRPHIYHVVAVEWDVINNTWQQTVDQNSIITYPSQVHDTQSKLI